MSQKGHDFHNGFRYFTQSFARTKAKQAPSHPLLAAADRYLQEDAQLCAALGAEKVAFRAGFADYLKRELARRAQSTEVCTFDALISEVGRALSGPHRELLLAALRNKYRAALVDEFQDTDPAQYAMFRQIFGQAGRALLLIGDPKQAIYAFRGADVQAYLSARADAGEHVYTLDVNRRSDPALIGALNALYARVERPFLREEIAYHAVSAPAGMPARFVAPDGHGALDLALLDASGTEDAVRREIARRVAGDIARLLSSGARRHDERHGRVRDLRASDIAVLCRTNREAHDVQIALSAAQIPAVLSGDSSVFDSEDAEHLERVLSALAHPAEPRALRAFLGSIYGGLSAHELLTLEQDDGAWDQHARSFRELHELFVARGFTQAIHGLCARYLVEERLLARP
ncbi:MAG TPA: UvrD-helicase domain-containing protein, partial [Polyangiales bacterium]